MANELNISTFIQGDAKRSGLYTEGVIGLDASNNALINDITNKYVAKKELVYDAWQKDYQDVLTKAADTSSIFTSDMPEFQQKAQDFNKFIVQNAGILTADGAVKNPELFQDFKQKFGQVKALQEASKANKVIDEKFKVALNDPQNYDYEITKKQYEDWKTKDILAKSESPYLPQVSISALLDDKDKEGIINTSKEEIKPTQQDLADKGTSYFSENEFVAQDKMYNNLENISGQNLRQKYDAYGKNSGLSYNQWVEKQTQFLAPSGNLTEINGRLFYVVPKDGEFRKNEGYAESMQNKREAMGNASAERISKRNNATTRYVAGLKNNDSPKTSTTSTTTGYNKYNLGASNGKILLSSQRNTLINHLLTKKMIKEGEDVQFVTDASGRLVIGINIINEDGGVKKNSFLNMSELDNLYNSMYSEGDEGNKKSNTKVEEL